MDVYEQVYSNLKISMADSVAADIATIIVFATGGDFAKAVMMTELLTNPSGRAGYAEFIAAQIRRQDAAPDEA